MNDYFDKAVSFVFKWEGYRSEIADDPGGLTIWGISHSAYPKIVDKLKNLDREAAREEAAKFYKEQFWNKTGKNLKWPLNISLFNTSIQFGIKKAIRILQNTYNKVFGKKIETDGILGSKTINALNSLDSKEVVVVTLAFIIEQLDWYNNSKNWKIFGLGWTNRLVDLYNTIIKEETL